MEAGSINELLDDLIEKHGGFGRFQLFIMVVVLGGMSSVAFSMMMMTFAGFTPDWSCVIENDFVQNVVPTSTVKQCYPAIDNITTTTCEMFNFSSSMKTVVRQWDLVCDRAWIPSTITTIQMSGVLLGGLFTGHLADKIGRKPTFFLSLLILLVFNLLCGFSVTWVMFAVCRCFLGIGMGGYLTIFYPYILEFFPKGRRAVLTATPMWGIWSTVFAFIAMGLPDWKYLHFVTAVCVVPSLLCWWSMPESFRWLVINHKKEAALNVIQQMANFNRKPIQNTKELEVMMEASVQELATQKTYTIRDLFMSAKLTKMTCLQIWSWLACGYGYYGVSFEVKGLTGNVYLNMALLSIVEIPAVMTLYFFTNRLGRKWTSLLFCGIGTFSAVIMAAIELTDLQSKVYRTVFPLISKIGVSLTWLAVKLLSIELFPTAIRSVSSGLFNGMARVGSMVAPQFVYLNDDTPGILYLICSGVLSLTFVCVCFMPETKNRLLPDEMSDFGTKRLKTKSHRLEIQHMTTIVKHDDDNIILITHM
ncbi:organic cation transporter-like protein [Ylistrum balloti]|uniref:organic cation transporter-like protein n=1 Tax=Ylistrum balloti TaxID=509963 RepID=UPI002905C4A7|nr:organic cation transporter-like protein [Ylistrum balloti]